MDGIIKGGGGAGGRVGIGEEDMGDGMLCSDHPYRNNPGGICAFCLQEKLGKLVSSSFPLPIRASSSSSSSPSFRSDMGIAAAAAGGGGGGSALSLALRPTSTKGCRNDITNNNNNNNNNSHYQEYYTRKSSRIPFLLAKKKKKITAATSSTSDHRDIVFKRSKSTTTPARRNHHFLDASSSCTTITDHDHEDFNLSPRSRKGGKFWSFLYLSSSSSSSKKATMAAVKTTNGSIVKTHDKCLSSSSLSKKGDVSTIEDDDNSSSPNSQATSSFERKVSRSRSVGCGSRSFSGDFFERISTGFGDCTLRRVESQREGKPKGGASSATNMKERVKCGGIFGGFMITSSSSSSSSSSYWVSSSTEDINGKSSSSSVGGAAAASGHLAHGRSRSWGWAFASPMRAFSKPNNKDGKRDIIREASSKNPTPNLSAIPSLLAVRG